MAPVPEKPDHLSDIALREGALLARCVAVDLEVDPKTEKIFALAAVRQGGTEAVVQRQGNIEGALGRLESLAGSADHLIGHNILRFDLPRLVAVRPRLANLGRAAIDTLWLNPLAFPRNPYHHLVKHYQDGRLQAGCVNDPEQDARLVFEVLSNQISAFGGLTKQVPDALPAYHFLTTRETGSGGFDAVFRAVRGVAAPTVTEARAAVGRLLAGQACPAAIEHCLNSLPDAPLGWPTAYALSWISVAGGDSVMPPWVRAAFPEAAAIVRRLRSTDCGRPGCIWCRSRNDPRRALGRWFGYDSFRPDTGKKSGPSQQELIVTDAMAGTSVLGILPTGTGKSICYQLPALEQFDKIGALTVVISPLVALMADQVRSLAQHQISACVTINGLLSLPERQRALDRVRMGEAAILLISPEQLRNVSVRSILRQREIAYWVLDEAHCISKWGHDFRPDYRYVARFIREYSGDQPPAPVICLTATAKPDVVRDICDHFASRLGMTLSQRNGGARRDNLRYEVRPTRRGSKLADILEVIEQNLPSEGRSGAVVYCSTRAGTERVAQFLQQQGHAAAHFHAGLTPEEKRDTQERFQNGALRIIAATNAFGMGIDKPDIRLVVHGDIPGSLENYVQEAGRAGRDQARATCVLLYDTEDVEQQFKLSARSRLARHEIGAILKALRRLDTRTKQNGEVVATPGEIVQEERDREFERDSATDDTRVKTAIAWLEEAALLSRDENRVQVFPSSLRVGTLAQAEQILAGRNVTQAWRRRLTDVVRHLMNAQKDEGISTDELMGESGLMAGQLRKAMTDLEALGIVADETAITIFVHHGVEGASVQRFKAAAELEVALISLLRTEAPDAEDGEPLPLQLAEACQGLRDSGLQGVRPDILEALLRGLAQDGRDRESGRGNIHIKKLSRNTSLVRLQCSWDNLAQAAELRRRGGELVLALLLGQVPKGVRRKDIQIDTTVGAMQAALTGDVLLRTTGGDLTKLLDRALLWLHEQAVVTLGRGLTVFRPALTLHLNRGAGQFTQKDFQPLEDHYTEQTVQTHVMAAYAEKGLASISEAERLSLEYFTLEDGSFRQRWLQGRGLELRRQATPASWSTIVEALGNTTQTRIVTDEREQTNVLVLAGPGSGKTRVLVHRIAYLIRIRREDPRGILVLTYNRHAAAEVQSRLSELIQDDAAGITISTCHALAMRLVGASFAGKMDAATDRDFDRYLVDATKLLQGDGLSKQEAEALRETLIQGYRWILVDEYQDIGEAEYDLIYTVAGRTLEDPELRLSLFAVGDDDQNIYAFSGASVRYIRQFEKDYAAKPVFLTDNYRSTRHIIAAANRVIAKAADRMKAGHDITIDGGRRHQPDGGEMERRDSLGLGRVQVLCCAPGDATQAVAAVDELARLADLVPKWSWARAAVIARDWQRLQPVRSYCETRGIQADFARDKNFPLWRLQETQGLVTWLRHQPGRLLSAEQLRAVLARMPETRWRGLLTDALDTLAKEQCGKSTPAEDLVEWLAEWCRDGRTSQKGLLLLTAHRAKGLEFDHVVILDGDWGRTSTGEDADAERRLFYVAMTRAKQSLAIMCRRTNHPFIGAEAQSDLLVRQVGIDPTALTHCGLIHQTPELEMIDLSFPGRLPDGARQLKAIAAAAVDTPVALRREPEGGRGKPGWLLVDAGGTAVGRMSARYSPPNGKTFVSGKIRALIRWRKSDSAEEYRHLSKRDEWTVLVPEFVFR